MRSWVKMNLWDNSTLTIEKPIILEIKNSLRFCKNSFIAFHYFKNYHPRQSMTIKNGSLFQIGETMYNKNIKMIYKFWKADFNLFNLYAINLIVSVILFNCL